MKNEPAMLISGVAGVLVTLAASYGLNLTKDEIVGVLTVSQMVFAYLVRQRVSPVG